jgi:hypothetical protein
MMLRTLKIVKVRLYRKAAKLVRRPIKSKRRRTWKMSSDLKISTKCLHSTLKMKMMTVEMTMLRQPTSSSLRLKERSNREGNFQKESAVCFKTAKVLSNAV